MAASAVHGSGCGNGNYYVTAIVLVVAIDGAGDVNDTGSAVYSLLYSEVTLKAT